METISTPLFFPAQATGQAVLTWLLEIPTGKEISGGQAHLWAHMFIFLFSLQGIGLGERDGEDAHISPFGVSLLSLCNGSGREEVMGKTSDLCFFFILLEEGWTAWLCLRVRTQHTHRVWGGRWDLLQSPFQSAGCISLWAVAYGISRHCGITLLGVRPVAAGGCEQGHPRLCSSCALSPPLRKGFLQLRSSWVSVRAWMSLLSVKAGRAVIFPLSAYRNRRLPSDSFLQAENSQRGEGPVRAGRASGPVPPARRELLQPRLFLTWLCCMLAVVSPAAFFLLCVSVCLCSSFLLP